MKLGNDDGVSTGISKCLLINGCQWRNVWIGGGWGLLIMVGNGV